MLLDTSCFFIAGGINTEKKIYPSPLPKMGRGWGVDGLLILLFLEISFFFLAL